MTFPPIQAHTGQPTLTCSQTHTSALCVLHTAGAWTFTSASAVRPLEYVLLSLQKKQQTSGNFLAGPQRGGNSVQSEKS